MVGGVSQNILEGIHPTTYRGGGVFCQNYDKKSSRNLLTLVRRGMLFFLFFCQLLGVLVSDILFYNLLAHVPQGAHVVAVWLHRWPPQKSWFLISGCAARNIFALWPFRCFTISAGACFGLKLISRWT